MYHHTDTVVPSHPHLRLGRRLRRRNKMLRFNHLAKARNVAIVKPVTFDYSVGLPAQTGTLLNDKLGCCTASAKYHRLQVVVFKLTGKFIDPATLDALVLKFYEGSTGYVPGDESSDQGGDMQDIAEYLIKTGMPLPGHTKERFVGAFDIDVSSIADMSYCGDLCGGVDFGIQVTTSVMPEDGSDPPLVWDYQPGEKALGGHDVFGVGYLPNGNFKVFSWGSFYEMTPRFIAANVQESLGYVSKDWMDKTGKTPLGMTADQWEDAMTAHAQSV